jgi:hypothetical protein
MSPAWPVDAAADSPGSSPPSVSVRVIRYKAEDCPASVGNPFSRSSNSSRLPPSRDVAPLQTKCPLAITLISLQQDQHVFAERRFVLPFSLPRT